MKVGLNVGTSDGTAVGMSVGMSVGFGVGATVGASLGSYVGSVKPDTRVAVDANKAATMTHRVINAAVGREVRRLRCGRFMEDVGIGTSRRGVAASWPANKASRWQIRGSVDSATVQRILPHGGTAISRRRCRKPASGGLPVLRLPVLPLHVFRALDRALLLLPLLAVTK